MVAAIAIAGGSVATRTPAHSAMGISHAALSSEHSRAGASMASQSTNRVSEMEFDDERGGSGSESSQYGGGITKRSSRGSLTGRMSV